MAVRGFQTALTGQSPVTDPATPPEVPQKGPMNQNIATYDQAIMDAKKQLNSLLEQYPDIDYTGKYMELQSQLEQQAIPEHPLDTPSEALKGFAYAFGAPKAAPAIMNQQIARHDQATDKRQLDLNQIKMGLLEKSIGAEEKKGNFQLALKQADALADLERAEGDRKRALDIKDWEQKQKIKTQDANTLLRQRVKNMLATANFHLDEKMKLKIVDFAQQLFVERMRQKSILGIPVEDIPSEDIMSEIMPQVQDFMTKIMKGEDTSPKVETPPAGQTAETPKPKSPYQIEFERIRNQGK